MSRAKFIKGTTAIMDGRAWTLLRQIATGIWQIEDNLNGELKRLPQEELLDLYLNGRFKFIETQTSTPSNCKKKRAENALKQFNRLPDKLRNRAQNRRRYVNAVLTQLGSTPSRVLAEKIISEEWKKIQWPAQPPHYVTVWRWMKRYVPAGNDIRAIVDRYCRSGNHEARLPEKLIEILGEAIDKVFLTEERNTIQDTFDYAISEVNRENILRVESDQLPMPRLRQVKRMIAAIPAYDRYAARYGKRAADIYFRSVKKTPGTSLPLERVEIDHTRLDVFVVDEETMLPLGRPWLTLCIDVHTRSILGFDLSFDPPSHLTVARCLRHAMLPKGNLKDKYPAVEMTWDMYGIMDMLVCDNGAEFHGESLELACLTLGITIQYCPRKQPWFKGPVERLLGSLNRGVAHGIPGTTFSNILEKGDYDAAKKATMTLRTLREIIHVWIVDHYHQRPHKVLRDTPAHAWHIETVGLDIPVPADPEELKALLGNVATRQLTHKGIEINSLFYNSPEVQLISRRLGNNLTVTVRYQADNLGEIHILVPDTNAYLAVPALDHEYAQGLTLWQHTVCRRYAKRQLDGRTDTTALAEAKRRITELVQEDFKRKARRTRNHSYRFLGDKTVSQPNPPSAEPVSPKVEQPKIPKTSPPAQLTPSDSSLTRRFTPVQQSRKSKNNGKR
ncbi:Mu transposase C-terminal domain-containing protein [Dechloromonas denitrificans]|uniref:Mu transposase C-terminal domain-containing protein n=1 Tax=Dechloromonas denitrificans TaxID=281362 RepID=UPI001CFC3E54|nr:Mu transposase C-terminal domain-containing protein [Dechloromonas denitrificans]UCV07004.1 transposase family protein [Dechloromonas denitrificans]